MNATETPIQDIIHHPFPRREFLIATVPDPVDSQVGWLFDGQLEAILSAIEREGPDKNKDYIKYVRDRYALPWECALQAISLIEKDPKLAVRTGACGVSAPDEAGNHPLQESQAPETLGALPGR